jgi:cell division protein FtsB
MALAPDAATTEESRTLQLARLISVRALVLGIVLLIAFSMLFPTLRSYLGQRAELDALATQVRAAEQQEKDLSAELARWDDQSYVAAQARSRLAFVMPGETSYRVIDPEVVVEAPLVAGTTGPGAGPAIPAGGAVAPWYASVWESVQIAGEAPMPTEPVPGDDPAVPLPEVAPSEGDG